MRRAFERLLLVAIVLASPAATGSTREPKPPPNAPTPVECSILHPALVAIATYLRSHGVRQPIILHDQGVDFPNWWHVGTSLRVCAAQRQWLPRDFQLVASHYEEFFRDRNGRRGCGWIEHPGLADDGMEQVTVLFQACVEGVDDEWIRVELRRTPTGEWVVAEINEMPLL